MAAGICDTRSRTAKTRPWSRRGGTWARLKILGASLWRFEIFENFPVALLSDSEILGASMKIFGASMWRCTISENFSVALMSGYVRSCGGLQFLKI